VAGESYVLISPEEFLSTVDLGQAVGSGKPIQFLKTYQEIGEKMGYLPPSARQAVSQFLKSGDPQIGMLRRFANAMGISLLTLLKDE
jgi:transcriptional regulator with XRE-family HTH domain